jgi:Uma2 family endonuclease
MTDAPIQVEEITEEYLMTLDPDVQIEVIDGELVEMVAVGMLHHFIAGNVHRILDPFVIANDLGAVFMDGLLYKLDVTLKGIRSAQIPDVSFVRKTSLPVGWDISRPFPGAPALAVEVMSPDDSAELLLKRVRKYLKFGSEQVWVLYPDSQELHQYCRDDPEKIRYYTGTAVVEADALFPGLKIVTEDLFKLPAWVKM